MAQPDNNNTLSSAFKTFFEREKLTGDNFNDWYRSLRIVLRVAGTYDYLFKPCPEEPPEDAAEDIKAAWKAEYKIHSDVACLMLGKLGEYNWFFSREFHFPQLTSDSESATHTDVHGQKAFINHSMKKMGHPLR
ncbi:hypothetical protein Tco_1025018 [Tanacetum coccineum]